MYGTVPVTEVLMLYFADADPQIQGSIDTRQISKLYGKRKQTMIDHRVDSKGK